MEPKKSLSPANRPETKEAYKAPAVEIVEVKVEQGVQMYSPPGPGGGPGGGGPSF